MNWERIAFVLYVLGMIPTAGLCVTMMGWTRRDSISWVCILLWPAITFVVGCMVLRDYLPKWKRT